MYRNNYGYPGTHIYRNNYGYANTHIYRRNGYPSVKMGTPKIGYPGQSRVTIFIEISFHVNNIMVMEVLIFTGQSN